MGESGEEAGRRDCPECRELRKQLEERDRRIAQLEVQQGKLQQEIEQLKKVVEELRRGQKRQAAPFSKGPPKENPKKPGRKPGKEYGIYSCRQPPRKNQVHEHYRARLPKRSPCCGAPVKRTRKVRQYQDEVN